jgi:hypothetical protein
MREWVGRAYRTIGGFGDFSGGVGAIAALAGAAVVALIAYFQVLSPEWQLAVSILAGTLSGTVAGNVIVMLRPAGATPRVAGPAFPPLDAQQVRQLDSLLEDGERLQSTAVASDRELSDWADDFIGWQDEVSDWVRARLSRADAATFRTASGSDRDYPGSYTPQHAHLRSQLAYRLDALRAIIVRYSGG